MKTEIKSLMLKQSDAKSCPNGFSCRNLIIIRNKVAVATEIERYTIMSKMFIFSLTSSERDNFGLLN